MHFFSGVGGL